MRVLIIESDGAFAGRLEGVLRARGVEVEITADGKDGLDRAHGDRPAAIVLAVELGDKLTGGYAYCNKLKKDDDLKGIPLVLISSQATPETFEQHKKLKTRAEEYLIKPFEPDDLIERLGRHLEMPHADIDIDDLGDDGVQVEEVETFELGGEASTGGDDDLLKLDEAFSHLSDAPAAAPAPAAVPSDDDFSLGSLGELDDAPPAPTPEPVRTPTPGPRPTPRATPGPRAVPSGTPGPSVAAAEAALQIAELKGQIAELEAQIESTQRDLQEQTSDADSRTQRLEADIARKDSAVKTAQARADVAQAQVRKLEATLSALKADSGRIAALEEELANVAAARDAFESQRQSVETKLQAAESRVRALEGDREKDRERSEKLQRDLDTLRQELHEARLEADTESDRMKTRVTELEGEASRNEERVMKAYQKIKGDEKVKEKTKKALAIALQLLDEHSVATDDDEARS